MVNLRAAANVLTSAVNPNVSATVRVGTGWTNAPGARRIAAYAPAAPLTVQLQALSRRDVEHLSSLNITDAVWSCYANLQLTPLDRKTGTPGDLITFTDPQSRQTDSWLVTAVLEGWSTAGWCRVALTKQLGDVNA